MAAPCIPKTCIEVVMTEHDEETHPVQAFTDAQLLVACAEACGLEFTMPAEGYSGWMGIEVGPNPMNRHSWNPLKDAGDRAVMCDQIGISLRYDFPEFVSAVWEKNDEEHWWDETRTTHPSITIAANRAACCLLAALHADGDLKKETDHD